MTKTMSIARLKEPRSGAFSDPIDKSFIPQESQKE